MRLKGKTALVTAAGQGIGKASALAMAAQGARVWATDVNAQLLAASLQERINVFVDPVAARRNFVARQPMGRLAQAHENRAAR